MHPGTLTTVARTTVIVIAIIVAATLGLFVGDALRDRGESPLSAGGAISRTADASFSLEAIAALAAIRDTGPAAAVAEDYADYPLRHPAAPRQAPPTSPSGATLE
jgi:hypothetical protein